MKTNGTELQNAANSKDGEVSGICMLVCEKTQINCKSVMQVEGVVDFFYEDENGEAIRVATYYSANEYGGRGVRWVLAN